MIGTKKVLYKIKIVDDILYYKEFSILAIRGTAPFWNPKKGVIRKGITGTVIRKWGRKYFAPDIEQKGIEDFTPVDQPHILIPYKKVENRYEIIDKVLACKNRHLKKSKIKVIEKFQV